MFLIVYCVLFILTSFIHTHTVAIVIIITIIIIIIHSFIMICGPSHEDSSKQNRNTPSFVSYTKHNSILIIPYE